MKKLLLIVILLVVGGGGAYYYMEYGKPKEKPQIVQAPVMKGDIVEAVVATGTLEAQRLVQVGSQVSGVVQDLYVDFNNIVKAGQLVAKIDPSLLQVQVDIQQANIDRQLGDIENQKVQLDDAKRTLARTQSLFDRGLAKQQELEQAQLAVKNRQASIDSAQKSMIQSNQSLKQAQLNVDYTNIKSPVDGVVVNRAVDKGQTVQSSVNVATFFTIATDLTTLKLSAGVDEADIGKVQRGMPVEFMVDSYGQTKFSGVVDAVRLNATTQNNVVTYPVWITVPNNDLKLRPSMTANLKIIIQTANDVIRIPNQATRFKPTNDMYTALGVTPPQAGRGQRAADAQNGAPTGTPGAPATTPAPGTPGAPAAGTPPANGQAGAPQQARGGQNGDPRAGRTGNGSGRGFGGGAAMTDEQRAAMAARYNTAGGRGTGGRGGGGNNQAGGNRNGRGGGGRTQTPANATGDTTPLSERNADKIDDLFIPPPRVNQPGQVWIYDEANKTQPLRMVNVRLGVTDGQFSEMVSGDIPTGQQVVTGIILPTTGKPGSTPNGASPFNMQQQRGGPGGFGAAPAGGGGGRGGGGGGGRGGN